MKAILPTSHELKITKLKIHKYKIDKLEYVINVLKIDEDKTVVSMTDNLHKDEITILDYFFRSIAYYPKKDLAQKFMNDHKLSEEAFKEILFILIIDM